MNALFDFVHPFTSDIYSLGFMHDAQAMVECWLYSNFRVLCVWL